MKQPVHRIALVVVTTFVALAALTGCGVTFGDSAPKRPYTLTVLAASSLTETFDQLAKEFMATHGDVTVKLVYDSSATLAEQAEQGAPGDILATADKKTMDDAVAKGGTRREPQQFASNVLMVAVPSANPAGITSFADLQKSSVKYVACVKTAPCGATAATLLTKNKITHPPVSEEVDVKSVLAKISANEADAGLVYKTDVQAAGDKVKGLDVPGADVDPNTYWVSITKNVDRVRLARDWIKLMQSSKGQAVFAKAGFGPK